MKTKKPTHSQKTLRELIKSEKVEIRERKLLPSEDLGWSTNDKIAAILKLKATDCYNSRPQSGNPAVMYDYYRTSNKINDEFIYTHFYIEDGVLVIDSMKRRGK